MNTRILARVAMLLAVTSLGGVGLTGGSAFAAPVIAGSEGCVLKLGERGNVQDQCEGATAGKTNSWALATYTTADEVNNALAEVENDNKTYVNQVILSRDMRLNASDQKDAEQDARLNANDSKDAAQDHSISAINNSVTNISADVTDLENRVTSNEGDIVTINNTLADHTETLNKHEQRINQNGSDISAIQDGAVFYNRDADGNKTGAVTFDDGTGKPVQLSNVAAGKTGTNAVNVDQLTAALDSLGGGAIVNSDGTLAGPVYTVGGTDYDNVGNALAATNKLSVQYVADKSGQPTNTIALTGDGSGSAVTITNVADGVADSDAANYGQLKDKVSYDRKANGSRSNSITLVGGASGPLLFDPTNTKSSVYNPLLEVRRGEWEVRDVQNIADILVDPEGSLEKRNHWEKTSHALLVGAILHVLYAEEDKTLAGVAAFLSDPKRPIESTLAAMMKTAHLGEAGPHPVIASAARELLNKSDNERSGVLSTAMSFLGLYRDPVVAEVTRRCDWRITDIVGAKQPTTLYLVVPPSDINRTKPLIRLILNQVGRRLTEDLQAKAGRHRLLLMLDEFPALGRLDFFETALAFMAGYGLKSFLIAQSLNQIEKAYGANNSILDNCHVRVSFATNDERTAKRVSDALGTATEMKAMKNYAGHRLSPWLGHLMVSRSETARPLLTPGEIMQLPPAEEIVMVAGAPPIRAKKARYYEDARFQERVLPPPAVAASTPARPDDWTSLPRAARPELLDGLPASHTPDEGPTGSERRHQPELDRAKPIEKKPPVENEFEIDLERDEDDDVAARNRRMTRMVQGLTRQVSLDPNDGMEL